MTNTAVIINEFGEVGLDHNLIETTDENIVELQNGCICCTIQQDLKSTLLDLIKKMERNTIPIFNRVVIETTGLADPVPIIHTLMTSLDLHRAYSIDGVITLVDAVNGNSTYDKHEEAIKQTALADKIILSKTDLSKKTTIKLLKNRIKKINPKTVIIESTKDNIPLTNLLGLNDYDPLNISWDAREWLAIEKYKDNEHNDHDHDHDHNINRHGDSVESFSLVANQQISITTFNFFIELLSSQMGSKLLRIKGMLNIKGKNGPAIIHGVQHIFHPVEWLEEWPDEDHSNRLVFITRDIKKSYIEEFFKIIGENEIKTRR
jgi:G3E family GTPase